MAVPRSVFLVPLLLSGALTAQEVEKVDQAIDDGKMIPGTVDEMMEFIADAVGVDVKELWYRTDGGLTWKE